MKIVLVSSEVAPFSKSGGLGDAVAGLAKAYARAGHDVWTVSPRYRGVASDAGFTGFSARISLASWEHRAAIHQREQDGISHLFVENGMFDRDGLYGDLNGTFGDNHIRFALLCQAALHATRRFVGEDVVFHCHDWQAALLPAYLKAYWRPVGLFERSGTVLTLHNPAHQGRMPSPLFLDLELPARWFSPWGLEFHGDLCLLKGGILHADQLTTVSPTFAREIVTPGGGFGLEGVLGARAVDLTGILNGIDPEEWNPATDPYLAQRYGTGVSPQPAPDGKHFASTPSPTRPQPSGKAGSTPSRSASGKQFGAKVKPGAPNTSPGKQFAPEAADLVDLDGKRACKLALQSELGLPTDAAIPLIGSVGRLDPQKGIELIVDSIPWLAGHGAQIVILGSAAPSHRTFEHRLRELEQHYPSQVRAWLGYSEPVAHRIIAGSDLFVMPSLFEPCGLTQMYAQRFGTLPVVRRTGGLADSVEEIDAWQGTGTGLFFDRPSGAAFRDALWRGLELFGRSSAFDEARRRGMARDFSWDRAVPAYVVACERALASRSG